MENPATRWQLGNDKALLLIMMAVALLTFAVYVPSLHNGYVYYDCNRYITMNQSITHLDLPFVRWAFTTFQVYNWQQPLTWISYALDHALWGKDPFGYHLAFAAERISKSAGRARAILFVLSFGALLSVLLTVLTVRQIRVWKDDITLWSREIEVYPYSVPLGYIYRADAYSRRGMTEQAIADYSVAVQVDSQNSEAYYKRGKLYYVTGRMRLAANDFAQALLFRPDFHEARYYKQVAEEGLR